MQILEVSVHFQVVARPRQPCCQHSSTASYSTKILRPAIRLVVTVARSLVEVLKDSQRCSCSSFAATGAAAGRQLAGTFASS